MALPKEVKDDLREKVRVIDVIREYLRDQGKEIRDQGEEFRSSCPFEEGSTSSGKFRVSKERFYCYACEEGRGDIFDWFMKIEAMTYPEAEAEVAKRAGVDLTPYLRSGKETEQDKQRRQIAEALGLIAAKSKEVAMRLSAEDRKIAGADVTPLVEFGEIGLLPTEEEIKKVLDSAQVSAEVRRAAGITGAGAEFSRRWVFWARKRDVVVAGRLFGRPGPVVGQAGSKSVGWTVGPQGTTPTAKARCPFVLMDDNHYIQMRCQGVTSLVRPVSPGSFRQAKGVTRFEQKKDSPIIVIAPEAEARAEAFESALLALPVNPRLRIVEWENPEENKEIENKEEKSRAESIEGDIKERAGTILDWQLDRLARLGGFKTPGLLAKSKERVGRIVDAVKDHRLEAEVYQGVIEEMTTPPKNRRSASV